MRGTTGGLRRDHGGISLRSAQANFPDPGRNAIGGSLRERRGLSHMLASRRRICLWALVNGNWLNRLWPSQRPCVSAGILAASRLEI